MGSSRVRALSSASLPSRPAQIAGSIAACREKGTLRLEGKEYVVKDGDVINYRFAV